MPQAEQEKATQREQWGAVADAWDRHYEWNARSLEAFVTWCCDATGLAPGYRVLDVACGPGLPALAVAKRVQPGGSVVGVDISPEMLALASRRAASLNIANVEFREMSADALDFPDGAFDAVTFAFGLMFCPDPARAVAEIRRVLRPGGRFAIGVWDKPTRNSFLAVFGRAALDALSLPRPPRDAPGPFRFADPGALESVLRAGGFSDLTVESLPLTIEYESVDGYLAISRQMAAGLKPKLDALTPMDSRRLDAMVREAVAPFVERGRVRLTITPLCASGSASE